MKDHINKAVEFFHLCRPFSHVHPRPCVHNTFISLYGLVFCNEIAEADPLGTVPSMEFEKVETEKFL